MIYTADLNNQTCLKGMADGEEPRSQIRGYLRPWVRDNGGRVECGPRELLGFQRSETSFRGLNS